MARYRWLPEEKKWVEIDEIRKDPNAGLNGPIWCPNEGYYDKALNRKFESKEEKRRFMRENGLKMEGGDRPHLWNGKKEGSTYYSYSVMKTMNKGYKYR